MVYLFLTQVRLFSKFIFSSILYANSKALNPSAIETSGSIFSFIDFAKLINSSSMALLSSTLVFSK